MMRKYNLDISFFKTIDSEAKAYWLGFISADGGLTDNSVYLNLSCKDKYHLQKLQYDISSNYPIHTYSNTQRSYVSLGIHSKEFINHLFSLGVTKKKSLTISPALGVPSNLLIHYWRGFFDGDGTIVSNSAKNPFEIGFVGSKLIVEAFHNFMMQNGAKTKTKPKQFPRNNAYIVKYKGKKVACYILNLLYTNSTVYLSRKYQLAKDKLSQKV